MNIDYHKKYIKYKTKYLQLKNNQKGGSWNNSGQNEAASIAERTDSLVNNFPKYMVFSGDRYYAEGGWHDIVGTAKTLEEAKILYKKGFNTIGRHGPQERWAHIVDIEANEIILDEWNYPDQNIIDEWEKNDE